jgi:2-phosphosulfolactate phosphatase
MAARRRVQIDALAESAGRHRNDAIICVDVLLCSTTAVTSAARGRRTFIVPDAEEARRRAGALPNPVLAFEIPAQAPPGFDTDAGPAALERRKDVDRPLVLTSPTARVLANAMSAPAVYLACLRNAAAVTRHVALHHERVTVVAAGHGPDPRCEDQMLAARIAQHLVRLGFEPEGFGTLREIARWRAADMAVAKLGRGAELLKRAGDDVDLEFALSRQDDLDFVCEFRDGEVVTGGWLSEGRAEAV